MRRRIVPLLLPLLAALSASLGYTCRPLEPVVNEVVLGDLVLRTWLSETVRTGRTQAEYRYVGELQNTGGDGVTGVVVAARSLGDATTILDSQLVFGDVPPGSIAPSQDTYTIVQDRTQPYDPTLLEYAAFEDAIPTGMLDFAGTVGSAGGIVDAQMGRVVLEFPPGAVATETDIRVSPLANVGVPRPPLLS